MKNLFLAYLKDEDGQTSTEYILLVAVVAMIVFRFKDVAEKRLMDIVESVFSKAGGFVNDM
jgi:pilus assembly protein Flp/PilA